MHSYVHFLQFIAIIEACLAYYGEIKLGVDVESYEHWLLCKMFVR